MAETQSIEDVLSSVRRLVSEEAEAQTRRIVASDPERLEALVLGPDDRVQEPENPFQAVQAVVPEDATDDTLAFLPDAPADDDALSFADEVVVADASDGSMEGWDVTPAPDGDFAASNDDGPVIEDAEEITEVTAGHAIDMAENFALADPGMEEVDGPLPDDSPSPPVLRLNGRTAAAPVGIDRVTDEADALHLGEALASEGEHEDDILAGGIDEALPAGALDAEAIREIVAEVVRQELAGALGERITRNVRKLVRRELRAMMAGEELD